MAELKRRSPPVREDLEKVLEAGKILFHVGRQLEQGRSHLRAEDIDRPEEVGRLLAGILQAQLVGDSLVRLDRKGESVRHMLRPGEKDLLGEHSVKSVVNLDRGKSAGIVG